VENATSPRLGATVRLPGSIGCCAALGQVLPGAAAHHPQWPPCSSFAQSNNLGFIPLHGERDEEYQFGLTIPIEGWTVDIDHFHTLAKNFFDHNNIGNSHAFLPLTIDGALIQGNELAISFAEDLEYRPIPPAYSNQTADGIGAINGGSPDFSPPSGSFALDHDQRKHGKRRIRHESAVAVVCFTKRVLRIGICPMARRRQPICRAMRKSI